MHIFLVSCTYLDIQSVNFPFFNALKRRGFVAPLINKTSEVRGSKCVSLFVEVSLVPLVYGSVKLFKPDCPGTSRRAGVVVLL